MSSNLESRYYVYVTPGGNSPVHIHHTLEEAKTEAKRLAQLNPYSDVIVVKAMLSYKYVSEPFIVTKFHN